MLFPDQNSTNFPISVKNNLLNIAKGYSAKEFLKYNQYIVYNYLINSGSRGLLLFHDMGYGKSITAAALAEYYRKHEPDRRIVVLLAKSLQANFQANIEKVVKANIKEASKNLSKEMKSDINADKENNGILSNNNSSDSTIDKSIEETYKFISLNASNMFTQMTRVGKSKGELELEKQLKEFTDIAEKDDFLENSLLIIDEFHNFSNSVTNGSYNALRLYDTIMRTKNIKLLFLSGTPIINGPFELVPTFNMLKGLQDNTTLFPELQRDFDMYFVDAKTSKIKNVEKFKNRIFGMCSYYGDLYFDKQNTKDFPQELPIKVEKVYMSADQYSRYNMVRDFEREEANMNSFSEKATRFTNKSTASKSYRVQSRQISNYLIPDHALGPYKGKKARTKYINKITDMDLKNLDVFSPKFKKILENIDKHINQLGLVYSEFVSGEGIAIFAKVLNTRGYSCWNKSIKLEEDVDTYDLNTKGGVKINKAKADKTKGNETKKYALITGDISFDERTKIVDTFNADNNKTGDKIELLLISKTGAEGLDLKNIRHIHLIEPYWNYARLSQIIARAVRYKSHVSLAPKFRNVQPYIYLSDYPKDFDVKKKKELTTDVDLFTKSIKNKKLIKEFYTILAEASIDCSAHSESFPKSVKDRIKCKLCSPNNQQLYHPILSKQMILPDPCQELKEQEIKVKTISIPGHDKTYAYSKDSEGNFHIYKFDININGYTLMDSSDYIYSDIMKKLLNIE